MILQYRTNMESANVKFLHKEDFRSPEIEECIILWECRIPLDADGINDMYIEVKKVEISYKRYIGNPNEGEEILLSEGVDTETFDKPRTRIRFIDKLPVVRIKPVDIWISYCDDARENRVTLIEFSK